MTFIDAATGPSPTMTAAPRVSVVTIFLNAARFLEEAIATTVVRIGRALSPRGSPPWVLSTTPAVVWDLLLLVDFCSPRPNHFHFHSVACLQASQHRSRCLQLHAFATLRLERNGFSLGIHRLHCTGEACGTRS